MPSVRPWCLYSLTATAVLNAMAPAMAATPHTDSAAKAPMSHDSYLTPSSDSLPGSSVATAILRLPAVHVIDSNGFGLWPNIGLYGMPAQGSAQLRLTEDGVLAAPSANLYPVRTYLPGAASVERIGIEDYTESVPGAGLGQSLAVTTTQIPTERSHKQLALGYGNDASRHLYGMFGGENNNWGSLLEYAGSGSDGFSELPDGQDSGFSSDEVMFRIREKRASQRRANQSMELKVRYGQQQLDQAVFGITDEDHRRMPERRYAASQRDKFELERLNLQLDHRLQLARGEQVITHLYYNDLTEELYQAESIDGLALASGGVERAAAFENSLAPVGGNEASPEIAGLSIANLGLKQEFATWGVQSSISQTMEQHRLRLGIRYQKEQLSARQWRDHYQLDPQLTMQRITIGEPGEAGRWRDDASSWQISLVDELTLGTWQLALGIRYEDIRLERDEWRDSLADSNAPQTSKRDNSDTLFSASLSYPLSPQWQFNAGVEQGFTPASNDQHRYAAKPLENEENTLWQLGVTYQGPRLNLDARAYFNDFTNVHGHCVVSLGCQSILPEQQVNGGDVEVAGADVMMGYQWQLAGWSLPITLGYSYSSSEFTTAFDSLSPDWGRVIEGDELAYLPEHKAYLSMSLVAQAWQLTVAVSHQSEQRTQAGQGDIPAVERLDARTLVDLSGHYNIDKRQQVSLSVQNLLDETYRAARFNGGIQSGKPVSVMLGYRYTF